MPTTTRLYPLLLSVLLAGCGVETATTAAVAAKAKEEEAKQGKALQQDLTNKIDAAAQLEQKRLDAAAQGQ